MFVINRSFLCLFLIFAITKLDSTNAKQVACESIYAWGFNSPMESLNTCWIYQSTTIDEPGVTLTSASNEVTAISFWRSNQIFYLPEHINGNFPNLTFYDAYSNALTEITKENFVGLNKLRWLHLHGNKLERIPNNTFDDLSSLEVLRLSEFKFQCFSTFVPRHSKETCSNMLWQFLKRGISNFSNAWNLKCVTKTLVCQENFSVSWKLKFVKRNLVKN